jgi:glycosyltransferase involved in cell wall biosynthesis
VSTRRRILVVTPFMPSRDATHGGGRMSAELLLSLATRHRVALLALGGVDEEPVSDELRTALDEVVEVERRPIGHSPRRLAAEPTRLLAFVRRDPGWVVAMEVAAARRALAALLAEWRPDVVQLETLALARYASAARPLPVVLVHYDAAAEGSDATTDAWARHARRTLGSVDALVVFTDADRDRAAALGAENVHVIRPGIDLPPRAPDPGGSGVAFAGAFMHEPNVEAARRLVRDIHPLVRARRPDAKLTIVGADPPTDLLERDGVRVTGRVPDLAPYLEGAAVLVAPLSLGSGVRIKVLDALARGKALVATPKAIEGLAVHDGEQLLVRSSDDDFADAVVSLLDEPSARTRLGTAARAWAEAHLSWTTALDAYDRLYEQLLRR